MECIRASEDSCWNHDKSNPYRLETTRIAEMWELSPALHPVSFFQIGTREDANIHIAFAYRYLSNDICTVVEEWTHGYFCLGYFSSSTHFDLVIRLGRQCVLVFVHDLGSRHGNCIGLLAKSGLFLSLVTGTFSSFTANISFRFLTTAPVSILPCLASKFRNRSF